ncbi:hypothetical protein [Kocuria atrinae]
MDSMDTWPTPVTVDDRGFDLKAMQELRRNPSATSGNAGSSPAGNASPPDGASDPGAAASGTSEASPASPGAPAKVGTREKLANSMILVIPVVSALAIVLCWMRYADTNNGLWLGAIAVILVLAAITWISSVKKAFARAQGHLATRLPGVIGYGVGIIREVDVDSPFDENGVSDTVTAHLVLSVNPVQGPKFQAPIDAVYNTSDSEKLTVGAHGPVRYLRSDPENTVSIETRLDDARIRQIYQGAAMN